MRLAITFRGRVQGVGFRATAKDCADGQPVTGWVRNEADGSVAMEIQGDAAAVEAVLARLRARMKRNIQGEERAQIGEKDGEVGFVVAR